MLKLGLDRPGAGQERPVKLVANLPYSITSAALRHALAGPRRPSSLVVMVQEEVARRIVAAPPEMSLLAVSVQLFGRPRLALRVPSDAFVPPPNGQLGRGGDARRGAAAAGRGARALLPRRGGGLCPAPQDAAQQPSGQGLSLPRPSPLDAAGRRRRRPAPPRPDAGARRMAPAGSASLGRMRSPAGEATWSADKRPARRRSTSASRSPVAGPDSYHELVTIFQAIDTRSIRSPSRPTTALR